MKNFAVSFAMLNLLLYTSTACRGQEVPDFPPPTPEHKWLEKMAGEWNSAAEVQVGSEQPVIDCKGTQRARMLGGFWLVAEGDSDVMGMQVRSVLTLGYDPEKKKYVGTWVDSTNSYLWHYTGTLDEAGKKLTLEAEGPNPALGGKVTKFRDAMEFVTDNHYVFTSQVEMDGQWVTFMKSNFRRK